MLIVNLLLFVLYGYLAVATLYYFFFGVASLFPVPQRKEKEKKKRKFAVLIPGYKEDAVIVEVARDALNQTYDNSLYEVVVIADSFRPQTLEALRELPIRVVEVSFEKSTKSKALNEAMKVIGDDYDVALVLDADNVMQPDFIDKVNDSFNRGFTAVQGHRVAKNLNTSFAILDAISEEIGNNLFRKGQRVVGLSSGLAGSGMAFDYDYFKKTMSSIQAIGGFDKELELRILEDKRTIEYRNDAWVYDEKVQKADVFFNQRRRWLSTQATYSRNSVGTAIKALFKGNINYANKVFQWFLPPRVLYLGAVLLVSVLVLIFTGHPLIFDLYLLLLLSCVAFFLISIPRRFYNFATLKAVFSLPRAFILMVLALLKLKGANKQFIHTEHTSSKEPLDNNLRKSKAN